jgi:hypothetical protein
VTGPTKTTQAPERQGFSLLSTQHVDNSVHGLAAGLRKGGKSGIRRGLVKKSSKLLCPEISVT